MKKALKFIVIFLIILLIIVVGFITKLMLKNKSESNENNIIVNENLSNEVKINEDRHEEKNETLVVGIEKKLEENKNESKQEQEPKEEPVQQEEILDASTWTQNIYNLNMEIGTLYIPKTGLTTAIYSNSNVKMMEKMPCFLYSTGGLNRKGITLFVGHNRRNGKIFSENKKLNIGDTFYFKDYQGVELEYTIYDKFITNEGDISFLSNQVDSPVIVLSCCTDASDENRIIILGKAN